MNLYPLHAIDLYKSDHRRQYPDGTTLVYSNLTPRSDKHLHKGVAYDGKVKIIGIQHFVKYFLMETFVKGFFEKDKATVIARYKRRLDNCLGKDAVSMEHIEALHDLGYLPIEIRAIKEGSLIPVKCPILTIHNTKPEFFWLTNYLETIMSCFLWSPITSATIAHQYRTLLEAFCEKTGGEKFFVNFQAHDFSFRGMPGPEAAALSGIGHLSCFLGTDTVVAIDLLEDYYHANSDADMVGVSVPATEHSVMCMGSKESEIETFKRLIKKVYPKGILSIVSDTWDLWQVLDVYAPMLKSEIEAREGKVVFRPDSGNPADILCGVQIEDFTKDCKDFEEFKECAEERLLEELSAETEHGEYGGNITGIVKYQDKYYECSVEPFWNRHDKQYYYIDGVEKTEFKEITLKPAQKGCLNLLWQHFGGSVNEKGYKVLNPKAGLIYGDSISLERAEDILKRMEKMGFCSTNIVFGIGSYTYQYNTRDTLGMAMKATYGEISGQGYEIYKDPATDDGVKKSAKGILVVNKDEDGNYTLLDQQPDLNAPSELKPVYRDGKLLVDLTWNEIRGNQG